MACCDSSCQEERIAFASILEEYRTRHYILDRTLQEHIKNLTTVVDRLREAKVKLSAEKCFSQRNPLP